MRREDRRISRVGSVRVFSPSHIGGLVQWVGKDVSFGTAPATATWLDLSGSGKHYTQPTAAKRPDWSANETDNGMPALVFAGGGTTHDSMTCASITIGHAFVVATFTAATIPYDYPGLFVTPSGGVAKWNMFQCDVAGGTGWYLSPAAGVTRWKDGVAENVSIGVQAQHIYEIQDTSPSARVVMVGGGNTTDFPAWPGWIAEVIVYNVILSTYNAFRVRKYLADKYNISGVTL